MSLGIGVPCARTENGTGLFWMLAPVFGLVLGCGVGALFGAPMRGAKIGGVAGLIPWAVVGAWVLIELAKWIIEVLFWLFRAIRDRAFPEN